MQTVLFIGGPASGKSNLLFRLWLELKNAPHSAALQRRGLPKDLIYLNQGAGTLLRGEFVGHTSATPFEQPSIPISFNGVPGELVIPDRPGEDWTRLFEERRWPAEWSDYLDESTTCLILVRAVPPHGQPDDRMLRQRFRGPQKNFVQAEDHSHYSAPLSVLVVDWIQILQRLFRDKYGPSFVPRIGIVISAWDELSTEDRAAGPMSHVENNHHLLHDFIVTNRDSVKVEVFGVTLFGGDLHDTAFSKEIVEAENPCAKGGISKDTNDGVRVGSLLDLVAWALSPNDR